MFVGNKRPELKDIEDHVVIKCAPIWKRLGQNLDIDDDLLNIIEKDSPQDCVNCCSKMLHEWLDTNPNASWGILLDAVNKAQNASNMMSKTLDTAADKLPDTVEKLDTAVEKLPSTVEKLDTAADKLPDTVDRLDTAADKLPDTVEKLDTAAEKLPDTVEKLDTAADKLPDTVEKLGSVAEKLPKAVGQLCDTIDKLPKVMGRLEATNLDNNEGNYDN